MTLGTDPRRREYRLPTRILWTQGRMETPEHLLRDEETVCVLHPGASVLLDFGRELHGGVRLDAPTTGNGRPVPVRIRFGESVSEAMGTPNNDHAIHDWNVHIAWMGRTEVGETGFRFVRLDVDPSGPSLTLRQVLAVFVFRPLERLGTFTCSDPRLNAIWQVGADTVHLCMQDRVWDGIKRDRLVWIGDLHPEAMVISTVFGQQTVVQDTLDEQRDRTPLPQWMNGISSYSLWWILIQRDWFWRGGDLTYLRNQKDYLTGLLTLTASKIDSKGRERLDGMRFLEWPTSGDRRAIAVGLQALIVLALRAGAELCHALGATDDAVRAEAAAARAAQAVRPRSRSKQANALRALAGMTDPQAINAEVLAHNPFQGLSTFYGYYVLQARALAGDVTGCLDLIRTYWGAMLDMGATTFWEGFELDWVRNAARIDEMPLPGQVDIHADCGDWCYKGLRHSLCHGWAAGTTAWLSEHILGIAPAAPGFATLHMNPRLGDLSWAHGTVPTPYGVIEVAHERRSDGTLHTEVQLPGGICIVP